MCYALEHVDARRPQSSSGSNNIIRVNLADLEAGWYNPYGRNTRHYVAPIDPTTSVLAHADAGSDVGSFANLDEAIGNEEVERMKK